jgi:hypothetical protein
MSGLFGKSALVATTVLLACGTIAGPVAAKGHRGHHNPWTTRQCTRQAARWSKAHKHPTTKQTARENLNLAKHGCANTV